jgi:hypothetical protein
MRETEKGNRTSINPYVSGRLPQVAQIGSTAWNVSSQYSPQIPVFVDYKHRKDGENRKLASVQKKLHRLSWRSKDAGKVSILQLFPDENNYNQIICSKYP